MAYGGSGTVENVARRLDDASQLAAFDDGMSDQQRERARVAWEDEWERVPAQAPRPDAAGAVLAVAAGEIDEEAMAVWLSGHLD